MTYVAVKPRVCTGCRMCEVVCSLFHHDEANPQKAAIRVIRKEEKGLVQCLPLVCQQCAAAACIEACPTAALTRGAELGTLVLNEETCTGCRLCVEACPAACLFMDETKDRPFSCDLCGGEPQCVQMCHSGCLSEAGQDQAGGPGVEGLIHLAEEEELVGCLPGKGGW